MTPTELPEGPLVDKNGNKWDIDIASASQPSGRSIDPWPPHTIFTYSITPHIEHKPLFPDLCNNKVCEGDEVHWYNIKESRYETTLLGKYVTESAWEGTKEASPMFLNRSDCEKWVASNVKTLTLEEALKLAIEEVTRYHKECNEFLDIRDWIDRLIKEKCFTPKQ